MKLSEFTFTTENPFIIKIEPIEDSTGMPADGDILEPYGDDNNMLKCNSYEHIKAWRVIKTTLPDNFIERRVLYTVKSCGTEDVKLQPLIFADKDYHFGQEQKIGLDDRLLQDVREQKKVDKNLSDEEILNWFNSQFLIEPFEKSGDPLLIIADYSASRDDEQTDEEIDENLYNKVILGQKYKAYLKKMPDKTLGIVKVTKNSSKKEVNFRLWIGKFAFTLNTREAKITSDPVFQQQFEQKRNDPYTFFNLWDTYLNKDNEQINSIKSKAGTLVFEKVEGAENSIERELILQKREDSDPRHFDETLKELPDDERIVSIRSENGNSETGVVICNYIGFRAKEYKLIISKREQKELPSKGIIELSILGREVANKRRGYAKDAISNKQCKVWQLYYHLFEQPIPSHSIERAKHNKIKESLIIDAFNGKRPNTQQRAAIDICLNTPDIALIQGPPGTGKTQVISALQKILGKTKNKKNKQEKLDTILLTSYQHDAVDNVAQRGSVFGLPSYRYGSKNKQQERVGLENWKNSILPHLKQKAKEHEHSEDYQNYRKIKDIIIHTNFYLHQNLPPTIQYKEVQKVITSLTTCNMIDSDDTSDLIEITERIRPRLDHEDIRRYLFSLRTTVEGYADDGLIRLFNCISYCKLHLNNPDSVFKNKADEIEKLNKYAEKAPDSITKDDLQEIEEIRESLLELIRPSSLQRLNKIVIKKIVSKLNQILKKLDEKISRKPAGIADILEDFIETIEDNDDVIRESIAHYTMSYATTCQKSGSKALLDIRSRHINEECGGFDYVIIDEAARANPLDLFIPMVLAQKKIILVGDHRQLPQLLEPDIIDEVANDKDEETRLNNNTESVNESNNISSLEEFKKTYSESLFERLWNHLRNLIPKRTVTLNEQYRMHPALGELISKVFYEKEGVKIISPIDKSRFFHTVERYYNKFAVWEDCDSGCGYEKKASTGWDRPQEATIIADRVAEILKESSESIGVITPYRAQEKQIKKYLENKDVLDSKGEVIEKYQGRLLVGTVDSFQGREFDVVIFSAVRSNRKKINNKRDDVLRKYGFLTFPNRLNVALSRQKKLLIVVGDRKMFSSEEAQKHVEGLYEFELLCRRSET
ncbi:MAG: AAA family ATPase [Desulfamplus sp.]|nr:AAA family ATPase [Desulfamplus sp.]